MFYFPAVRFYFRECKGCTSVSLFIYLNEQFNEQIYEIILERGLFFLYFYPQISAVSFQHSAFSFFAWVDVAFMGLVSAISFFAGVDVPFTGLVLALRNRLRKLEQWNKESSTSTPIFHIPYHFLFLFLFLGWCSIISCRRKWRSICV